MTAALLLGATALHAGFQLVVTLLVYPMLAHTAPARWLSVHARHSRAVTPLVALVYGVVLAACVAATVTDRSVGVWVADAGSALALGVTAVRAAPLHGRLWAGHDRRLLDDLLAADRVRCGGALLAVLGGLAAVLAS